LIRSGLAPEHPLQKDVQQVIQSTERAIGLTNQLLAISRKDVATAEVLNINLVLEQIQPLVRRLMGDGIETTWRTCEGVCQIRADRGQLETLIINLAVHARDSMHHGGRLSITTECMKLSKPLHNQVHLRAGEYVSLTISDTGSGLTEEYQEHLFEPFFGTTQPGKNTGLGLATVYAIVKQHGGQISCLSEVGKGSTFKIYFPATKLAVRQSAPPPRQLSHNGKAPVILIAEDEEVLREFANLILRKHGFHVLTARDGVEALKMAEQYKGELDLLFTDVVMPRMGGTDLYKKFTEKHPNTPVIFTSGYPRTILTESGLDERREYQFLQKPYTTQTLVEKIREVISAHRPGKPGI